VVKGRVAKAKKKIGKTSSTHPTDDVLVVGKMSFARFAAVDLVAGKVCVVSEPHGCRARGRRFSVDSGISLPSLGLNYQLQAACVLDDEEAGRTKRRGESVTLPSCTAGGVNNPA
jgi:hypothetical protein